MAIIPIEVTARSAGNAIPMPILLPEEARANQKELPGWEYALRSIWKIAHVGAGFKPALVQTCPYSLPYDPAFEGLSSSVSHFSGFSAMYRRMFAISSSFRMMRSLVVTLPDGASMVVPQ
jgi:hypothetical protein